MDTNDFKLICTDLSSLHYVDGSLVITPNTKSSPPPSITQKGSTWTVTLDADRSGSDSVANSFNAATGGAFHEFSGAGGSPGKLNFYFALTGTFDVQGKSYPVTFYVGQGHSGTSNPWWIGGNNVLNPSGKAIFTIVSGSVVVQAYRISADGSYTMSLTPA